jgi:hypothetical protein
MGMHRKNKSKSGTRGRNEYASWFFPSVRRRLRRKFLAKMQRIGKAARKRFIKRRGFLAQGFIPSMTKTVDGYQRKYMYLRSHASKRGMDGTLRS